MPRAKQQTDCFQMQSEGRLARLVALALRNEKARER